MSHGRIHDWKLEVESDSLKEARENETEDLWGWVNSHGDRLDLKRSEDRGDDAPRYSMEFTAATEQAAEEVDAPVDVEVDEPTGMWYGDTRSEVGEKVSPFLKDHGPEDLGYDGLGDYHSNGRQTDESGDESDSSESESDGSGHLKETVMDRLREKYSDDEGNLQFGELQKVAGDYDVSPVGHDAETLLEKIVDARVEESA